MKTAIEILQEKVTEAAFYLDLDEVNVIAEAMEEYAQQQLKILNIPVVSQQRELLLDFVSSGSYTNDDYPAVKVDKFIKSKQ